MTEEVATRLFGLYGFVGSLLLVIWAVTGMFLLVEIIVWRDVQKKKPLVWLTVILVGLPFLMILHYFYWWVNYGGPPW